MNKLYCPLCKQNWTFQPEKDTRQLEPTKLNRFTCTKCYNNMKHNIEGGNEHGLRKYDKMDR